jgi:hypothetical protein
MLGIIKGLSEGYDDLLDSSVDEEYGIPVFYDDDEMFEYLSEDE